MATLPETEDYAAGTYQIETSDRVLGGPGGIANKQAEQLGNRTAWLKAAIAKIVSGKTAVGAATQLATARILKFKGAASGNGNFDGSADAEITLTLADSGVLAGSYTKVTLNAKGLATAGENPRTLEGYGITNAIEIGQHGLGAYTVPESAIDRKDLPGGFYATQSQWSSLGEYLSVLNLPSWAEGYQAQLGVQQGGAKVRAFLRSVTNDGQWTPTAELYTSANFDPALKANKADTIAGYGIKDAYTIDQVNASLAQRAPLNSPTFTGPVKIPTPAADDRSALAANTEFVVAAISRAVAGLLDSAPGALDTLKELAAALGNDPNFAATITNELTKKAPKATSLAGYGITDAIAKGEYGLGASLIPAGAIDYKDLPGGFYSIENQWSSFGSFLSVLNLPSWAKGFPAQLGIQVGGAQAKAFVRAAGNDGQWLPPSEIWTSANFNPATKLDSAGIVMSLGPNGFLAFPTSLGRLIIQWGTVAAQSQSAHTVTFPQAYNSACFGVITSVNNSAGSNNGDSAYQVISKTNQNFTAFRQDYNTTNTGADSGYTWFSFGV